MHFGSHIFIGRGARISAMAGMYIGDHTIIGPELLVMGGDHNFKEVGKLMWYTTKGGVNMPVVIEDDVWIGARVTLLKGVVIGRGSVIGAGSVVTKSVPPYSVAAGNPCRVLRRRFPEEELRRHIEALRMDLSAD
jgi:acetyltransferase-like isoleucine patch superfamily enzyme